MHYTVRIQSDAHAVKETKAYIGAKRFNDFVKMLRPWQARRTERLRRLYLYLGIAGVSGRKVIHGVYRHIWPKG